MTTIETLTFKEKEELQVEIDNCLDILYRLEDITRYEEKAISNCIGFLQNLELTSVYDDELTFE